MFLSTTDKIVDTGDDYLVMIDYGSEGIVIHSQHETIEAAMLARDGCDYGSPMAIVKVCRIQEPVEI